jgi:hypothetical protein
MTRPARLASGLVVAALAVGGAVAAGQAVGSSGSASTHTTPTVNQAVIRQLLAQYAASPGCGCTAATRANQRVAQYHLFHGEGMTAKVS